MTVQARLAAAFRCRRFLFCLLVGVAALASWAPRGGGPIDLRWDGGAYYILGTSLAEGDGYRMRSEPGGLPSSLHPPLVPAFVALHQLALQTTDPVVVGRALKVSLALCSAAYAIAVFLLLSASLPLALAAGVTLVALLQPQYVFFSGTLFAEGLFGLFTVLFFVVRKWRRDALGFALCGVCAVLAYETRTAGIALLAAWVVDHALRKEGRRALVALAVSAVVVTSWNGWIKAVESSPEYQQPAYAYQTEAWLYFNVSYARNLLTYVDPFFPERGPLTPSGFVRRVKPNLKILPQNVGHAVSGWWTPRRARDSARRARSRRPASAGARREPALVVYVALSFAAICATPFQSQFPRYLLPLYPFLALALFEFLAWLMARVRLRWPALPPALAAAVPWAVLAVIALPRGHRSARAVREAPPAGVVRPEWAAGQLPALLLRPGSRGFRRRARLAGRACGSRRRDRHGRPAVGLSQDRPASGAAAVRARRARRPAADRQRARQVPDRVDRPGRLRALHRRRCSPPTRRRGGRSGAVRTAWS